MTGTGIAFIALATAHILLALVVLTLIRKIRDIENELDEAANRPRLFAGQAFDASTLNAAIFGDTPDPTADELRDAATEAFTLISDRPLLCLWCDEPHHTADHPRPRLPDPYRHPR